MTSVDKSAFECSGVQQLIIHGRLNSYSFAISNIQRVYVPQEDVDRARSFMEVEVIAIDLPYTITLKKQYIKGFSFGLLVNEFYPWDVKLKDVSVDGCRLTPDKDGIYLAKGLKPDTNYTISVSYTVGDKDSTITKDVRTYSLSVASSSSLSYTSITFKNMRLNVDSDPTCTVKELGIVYKGNRYKADEDGKVVLSGLYPNTSYQVSRYVVLESGESYTENARTYTTLSFNPQITLSDLTPTTFSLVGSYRKVDDELVETDFIMDGNIYPGDELHKTGLSPNTSYTITYRVKINGNCYESSTCTLNTSQHEFKTLKAKVASNTKAVICAETNISEEEVNTGFEWRRVDAPDIVPSEDAPCIVYNGIMEGFLQNLSSNTYYKYRPYYEASNGKRFYGDWIGFGTADAYVYFTPTVRTYATATVDNDRAILSGYVLQGSDDIIEQGFEYWKTDIKKRVVSEVQKVTAKGQRMSATIDGLEYGTTYSYRAYVTTGTETTYGEEMTFTTPVLTGIMDIPAEDGKELSVGVRCISGQSRMEVSVSGEGGQAVYRLYTLNGTLVKTGSLVVDGTWQSVDVNVPLKNKLYLLHVSHARKEKTVKFMPGI